ncbi:hypothetical protein PFISCL1PPCAC_11750, partial [Pristionchus fissidentatus]
FRRVKCNILKIGGNVPEIDFEQVEKILEFVDFDSLHLRFFESHQWSVFEFAQSSGRPIKYFHAYNTSIDAEMIVDLPRMEELKVEQVSYKAFKER